MVYFGAQIKPAILSTLDKAQSSVFIAMYCFNENDVYNKLLQLAQRGISINLVLSRQEHNRNMDSLQQAGAAVYFADTVVHHKFCVIDEHTSITGSANWTNAAFTSNSENIVLMPNNTDTAAKFLAEYDAICEPLKISLHYNQLIQNIKIQSQQLIQQIETYTNQLIQQLQQLPAQPQVADLSPALLQSIQWLQDLPNADMAVDTWEAEDLEYKKENGKYGFIDKRNGKVRIPFIYDDARNFSESLAKVEKDYKYGFIDKIGKEIIPPIYDYANNYSEGLVCVRCEGNGGWGFIDKTGKVRVPFIYDYAQRFCEGLASVRKGDKWGFIDKTGKEIIPFIYDEAHFFSEGLARVKKGDKYGFIDKTGEEIIPFIYDEADSFDKGLAAVTKGGKWGYVDKQGNFAIDNGISIRISRRARD